MPKFVRFLLWLVAGFAAGALIGGGLVSLVSANRHDKSLEIIMTAFFFSGPIGAVVGAVASLVTMRRARSP